MKNLRIIQIIKNGIKKSTAGMDFDSYSERLSDLNEFSKEYIKKPKKIQQKRFQIINDSMQMKGVSKVQFGKLNQGFTFQMELFLYHTDIHL